MNEFLLQITMLKRLQDKPQIIRLHADEERDNVLRMVMELGEYDLSKLLKPNPKPGDTRAPAALNDVRRKLYWQEMVEAVEAVHSLNIVHKDLKPANFVVVGMQLKLIDFGIAVTLEKDETHAFVEDANGTLNYMSPEALMMGAEGKGSEARPSTDVWSLGCILYYMTFGALPFAKYRDMIQKMETIRNPRTQIPYPERPGLDPWLLDCIKRCLVYDPKQRASIAELKNHPYFSKCS